MRYRLLHRALFALCAATLMMAVNAAKAHEPIFGVGPHTIHQYGIAVEAEREEGDGESETHLEGVFGITEDLAITVALPRHSGSDEDGWGALSARSKWRFYRNDGPGGSNQAAAIFGARFPAFETGPDSFGYLVGVAVGREARFEYLFGGLRYMLNTADADGFRPGNVFRYDLAVGLRPFPGDYEDPDLVALIELNGAYTGEPTLPPLAHASALGAGNRIGVGPGLILTYRNIMLKAGVDFTVMEGSEGVPFGEEVETVFAIESHLSPFSFIYGK